METKNSSKILRGTLLTIIGGICWGFSGACGQYLFTHYGLDTAWLASVRMISAGLLLVLYGIIISRKSMAAIWNNRKDIITLLVFSIFGLMFCQYAYLLAISYSNAGTATVLQYLFPVFIMLYVCISTHQLPKKIEIASIVLALSGTFILATHGNLREMAITKQGLIWGILAGIAVAFYSIISRSIMGKYGSVTVTGYGMLIGGVVLCIMGQTWNNMPQLDTNGIIAIFSIVLIGTVFAFTLYFQGIKDIGAVKASMLVCVELVSAALFAMIWLHTQFEVFDLVGFVFITMTVFLLAKKDTRKVLE
jgi:drug/metabolite transporter (DMT)-like permease